MEEGNKREPTEQPMTPIEQQYQPYATSFKQSAPSSFHQFNNITVSKVTSVKEHSAYPEASNKINYSRLVEEFKKTNPEEE